MSAEPEGTPRITVLRGRPSEEELAAVVVVLTALATPAPAPPARTASAWTSRRSAVRAPLTPGPGAWQAATRGS